MTRTQWQKARSQNVLQIFPNQINLERAAHPAPDKLATIKSSALPISFIFSINLQCAYENVPEYDPNKSRPSGWVRLQTSFHNLLSSQAHKPDMTHRSFSFSAKTQKTKVIFTYVNTVSVFNLILKPINRAKMFESPSSHQCFVLHVITFGFG